MRGGTVEPHWMAGGSSFWYVDPDDEDVAYEVDPRRNTVERLSDPAAAEEASETARLVRGSRYSGAPEVYELPSPDGRWWLLEKDGWGHLYLYDLRGKLIRRLTGGEWPVLHVAGVDEAAGWVYFTGHAEPRILDTHLYRVSLEGGPIQRLTEAEGEHQVVLSPSRAFFLDTHSTPARPPAVELRAADGTLLRTLSKASIEELLALGWTPPEPVQVKAADGETDLYGLLVKPWDFDPVKKYPVVEYLYGGPQTVWTPRTFLYRRTMRIQALAQCGFVVFFLDGHGTPERGKAFQDAVHRNFGRYEVPEHVAALRRAEKPFDLLVLPGQAHRFDERGLRYFLDAERRYFEEHLKP